MVDTGDGPSGSACDGDRLAGELAKCRASWSLRSACVLAWMMAGSVGCNDVTSGEDVVPLEVFVHDPKPGEVVLFERTPGVYVRGIPLPGVEVCQVEARDGELRPLDNCATTDEDGVALIWLPRNAHVAWTLTKEGYQSLMIADVTDGFYDPATVWPIYTEEFFGALCENFRNEDIDCDFPFWDRGALSVFTLNPAVAGAVFDIVGVADKPIYGEFVHTFSPTRDETTSNGSSLFFDVPPGDHEIRFGGAAVGCTPRQSWPTDELDLIAAPVRAGFHTYAGLSCGAAQP